MEWDRARDTASLLGPSNLLFRISSSLRKAVEWGRSCPRLRAALSIFLSRWVRGLPSNSGKALSSGLFGSFSSTFSQSLSCWVSSLSVTRMADPVCSVMVEKTAVLHVLGLGLGLRLTCFVPFDKDHGSV